MDSYNMWPLVTGLSLSSVLGFIHDPVCVSASFLFVVE